MIDFVVEFVVKNEPVCCNDFKPCLTPLEMSAICVIL